jgi:trehalose 6-phosphate synthase/phosphatase
MESIDTLGVDYLDTKRRGSWRGEEQEWPVEENTNGHEDWSALQLDTLPWQCMYSDLELDWREEVESILEHFTERTPGSLLDIKDCCYTWHFRDADPTFGLKQAKDLQLHFDQVSLIIAAKWESSDTFCSLQMLRDRPVGVIMCRIKKYVMVRPWRVNQGRAVSRILEYESESPYFTSLDFDFILAVGDERTDEDMFNVVQGSNW